MYINPSISKHILLGKAVGFNTAWQYIAVSPVS